MAVVGYEFLFVIGFFVLIVVLWRLLRKKKKACPKCANVIAQDSKWCPKCGYSFGIRICPKCGTENPPANQFCGSCGASFTTK